MTRTLCLSGEALNRKDHNQCYHSDRRISTFWKITDETSTSPWRQRARISEAGLRYVGIVYSVDLPWLKAYQNNLKVQTTLCVLLNFLPKYSDRSHRSFDG